MYRKDSGRLGFAWSRFISNAVPNFANDAPDSADLTPVEQDRLFSYQSSLPDPKPLKQDSFYSVGVVRSEDQATSRRVLEALQKLSILSIHPDDPVNRTELITRQFPHRLAFLTVHQQRKLVCLLFFWQEEVARWHRLEAEQRHLEAQVGEADARTDPEMLHHARLHLARVQKEMTLSPTARDATDAAPPGYSA